MTGVAVTDMVPAERYVPSSEDEEAWRAFSKPDGAKVDEKGNILLRVAGHCGSADVTIPYQIWRKMPRSAAAFACLNIQEESLTEGIRQPSSRRAVWPNRETRLDQAASGNEQVAGAVYLDRSVDLTTLPIPFVQFPALKLVMPNREIVCAGWVPFINEIAPESAPIIQEKSRVPYFIAGTLKEAELINKKLREERLKNGQSTVGKQRSSAHIGTLGPALLLDDDGVVFDREAALRALGAAAVIYSSHSYSFGKWGGRVVLFLSRPITAAEYPTLWDGINKLLGGGFDKAGRSCSQCYGQHARRSDQASHRRLIIEGAALNADALIELGQKPVQVQAAGAEVKSLTEGNSWFEKLPPEQKDEAIRHALKVLAEKTDILKLTAHGGDNLEYYKLITAVSVSGAPHAEDLFVEFTSKVEGADPEEALREKFKRCQADANGAITIGTLLGLAQQHGANFDQWKRQANLLAAGATKFRDFTDKGKPRPSLANAAIAIKALGIEIRQDLFHHRIIVKHKGDTSTIQDGPLTDDTIGAIRSLINNSYRLDCGDYTLPAVKEIARDHSFDPVLDYLAECQGKWDGKKRIDTWVTDYMGVEDTPLHRAIGRLMLIASAQRARVPGCKFDPICVLEGEEGLNKSTAIKILAGEENFSDQSVLNVSEREAQEQLEGIWLHESADLTGLKKAEVERVKTFASRQVDRARPAYGRVREDRPRRCTQWATTNDDVYLASQTGNRRFWPLPVGRIDVDALRRDRDQLWGEAATLEADGASIVLDPSLWSAAAEEQEKRRLVDTWEDVIENMPVSVIEDGSYGTKEVPIIYQSEGKELVRSADVLVHVLKVPTGQQHQEHGKRLARVMKRCGWQSGRVSILGKQCRAYWREAKTAAVPKE